MRSIAHTFKPYTGRHRKSSMVQNIAREAGKGLRASAFPGFLAAVAVLGVLGAPKQETEIGPLPPDIYGMEEARDMAATHMYDKAFLQKAKLVEDTTGVSHFRNNKTGESVYGVKIVLGLHPNEDTAYAIGEKEDDPGFKALAGRVVLRPLQQKADGTYLAGEALKTVTSEREGDFHPERSRAYLPVDEANRKWGVYVETNACVDAVCRSVETLTGAFTIRDDETTVIPLNKLAGATIINPNADLMISQDGSARPSAPVQGQAVDTR